MRIIFNLYEMGDVKVVVGYFFGEGNVKDLEWIFRIK